MNRYNPTISLGGQSVSKDDIEAATRLVHSLERLIDEPRASNAPTPQQLVKLAKQLRDVRKTRTRFFDEDLFGEPAWDMLLALYISDAECYRLNVTDLINASQAPSSTALRWIDRLQELGLIHRRENPLDRRSQFLEPTAGAVQKVAAFLKSAGTKYFPFE